MQKKNKTPNVSRPVAPVCDFMEKVAPVSPGQSPSPALGLCARCVEKCDYSANPRESENITRLISVQDKGAGSRALPAPAHNSPQCGLGSGWA